MAKIRRRQKVSVRASRASRHLHHDLLVMLAGFALAFVFCAALFELFNLQFHWIGGQQELAAGAGQGLHGSASGTTQQAASPQLIFSAEKTGPGYAVPGQSDVPLLSFSLSPSNDGFIHGMRFSLDDLAHAYDLKSLKLFLGDEQLGEVAFFEGKGDFQNLMVKFSANQLMEFRVTGTVSDQAEIGDRLILSVAAGQGIEAADNDGNGLTVVSDGAMKGPAVSVVHAR